MPVSPVAVSAGAYVSAADDEISDVTTEDVPAGHKVIAPVFWYDAGTIVSVVDDGPGLDWEVHVENSGSAHRMAIVSADAPDGVPEGTTVTVTLSASRFARGLRLASCDGLMANADGAVDGTDSQAATSTNAWAGAITTTNDEDVLFGAVWFDFWTGGITPAAGCNEIFDWTTSDGSESQLVAKEVSSAGAQTVGGSIGDSKNRSSATVAFKLAGAGTVPGTAAGTQAGAASATGLRKVFGSAAGVQASTAAASGLRKVAGVAASAGAGTGGAVALRTVRGTAAGVQAGHASALQLGYVTPYGRVPSPDPGALVPVDAAEVRVPVDAAEARTPSPA